MYRTASHTTLTSGRGSNANRLLLLLFTVMILIDNSTVRRSGEILMLVSRNAMMGYSFIALYLIIW